MGGIFKQGVAAAEAGRNDILTSLFGDFKFSDKKWSDVISLINDRRLIEAELMQEALLAPAFQDLLQIIVQDTNDKLSKTSLFIGLFIAAFSILLVISSCGGWRSLVHFMKRSIYDANVIIASLPPEIIMHSPTILAHLSKSNEAY